MSDPRDSTSFGVTTKYIKEPVVAYPEVAVSCVHLLGDEIQIEQGSGRGEIDLKDRTNGLISMSRPQALLLANTILKLLEDN